MYVGRGPQIPRVTLPCCAEVGLCPPPPYPPRMPSATWRAPPTASGRPASWSTERVNGKASTRGSVARSTCVSRPLPATSSPNTQETRPPCASSPGNPAISLPKPCPALPLRSHRRREPSGSLAAAGWRATRCTRTISGSPCCSRPNWPMASSTIGILPSCRLLRAPPSPGCMPPPGMAARRGG